MTVLDELVSRCMEMAGRRARVVVIQALGTSHMGLAAPAHSELSIVSNTSQTLSHGHKVAPRTSSRDKADRAESWISRVDALPNGGKTSRVWV